MKKFLSVLKVIVFAIGLCTLLLIGVGVAFSIWDSAKSTFATNAGPTILYETKFDTHTLKITESKKSDERVVTMNISGGSTGPASIKIEDTWNEITSSKIIPMGDGRYGILLFYRTADCDHSSYNIDLFTYGNGIKHVETLDMAEGCQLDGNKRAFYATLPVHSLQVEGFEAWAFTIPVSIRVGREIIITPLLTHEGIALIQQAAAKNRESIIGKLTREGDKDEMKDYLKAEQELKKALAPRTIRF